VTTNRLFVDPLIRDLDPRLISPGIEPCFHFEPASGPRRAHQMDHAGVVPERLPFPRQTDKREESRLDPVPLAGSGRIMTHRDRNSDLVRQLPQIRPPGTTTTSMAATPLGTNQQTPGGTLALAPVQPPPPPDTLHRKVRRVVADPHVHQRPIRHDIVDPIGDGLALGSGRPIMYVDLVGFPRGRNVRPPFLKASTSSFFFVSTEITGSPRARKEAS
jgi:hypothetical protein